MAKRARRVVTIGVASIEEVKARASKAIRGRVFPGYGIFFLTFELMWKVLAPKRWEILGVMVGRGPMSIREVARLVHRDVKAVHGDVTALRLAGVVKATETRKVEFPYDEIRVDVTLKPGNVWVPTGSPATEVAVRQSRKAA